MAGPSPVPWPVDHRQRQARSVAPGRQDTYNYNRWRGEGASGPSSRPPYDIYMDRDEASNGSCGFVHDIRNGFGHGMEAMKQYVKASASVRSRSDAPQARSMPAQATGMYSDASLSMGQEHSTPLPPALSFPRHGVSGGSRSHHLPVSVPSEHTSIPRMVGVAPGSPSHQTPQSSTGSRNEYTSSPHHKVASGSPSHQTPKSSTGSRYEHTSSPHHKAPAGDMDPAPPAVTPGHPPPGPPPPPVTTMPTPGRHLGPASQQREAAQASKNPVGHWHPSFMPESGHRHGDFAFESVFETDKFKLADSDFDAQYGRFPVRDLYKRYEQMVQRAYANRQTCDMEPERKLREFRALVRRYNEHDARQWKTTQVDLLNAMPYSRVHAVLNRLIWHQTIMAVHRGFYRDLFGHDVSLKAIIGKVKNSIRFSEEDFERLESQRWKSHHVPRKDRGQHGGPRGGGSRILVEICEVNMLVLAREVPEVRHGRPLLLNMAAAGHAGGGVKGGAGAQEEQLFRSSNYFQVYTNDHQSGWWSNATAVYSPEVVFFRGAAGVPGDVGEDGSEVGYPFLPREKVFKAACIAMPALSHPTLERDGRLNTKDQEATRNKIRMILRVAANQGHQQIVLCALGCGAFRNPPQDVAEQFHTVIMEPEFQHETCCIKKIWFSIIDDHNAAKDHNPLGNVLPFKEVFPEHAFLPGGPHPVVKSHVPPVRSKRMQAHSGPPDGFGTGATGTSSWWPGWAS